VARASGERARAAGLAEALLARAPHGPYAARCRAALAAKAVP
jgi:hypothetical protein